MASGHVDLIRPIYEEWGRGDWRSRFEVYDPHMEWGIESVRAAGEPATPP